MKRYSDGASANNNGGGGGSGEEVKQTFLHFLKITFCDTILFIYVLIKALEPTCMALASGKFLPLFLFISNNSC